MNKRLHQQGFTLVEMSIVLVIIGLIVGGVLVGQDLVKAAQVRAVVSQIQQYDAAVNTFRGKYDCLPGDCNKASTFLGCTAGLLGTTTQCNGDGDGKIEDLASLGTQTVFPIAFSGELIAFWSDLSLANMVAGQYALTTAAAAPGAAAISTDVNHPSTKLKKGGVIAVSEGSTPMWIIGTSSTMGTFTGVVGNTLNPTEAFGIDNKVDDGMVNTGMAVQITGSAATGLTRLSSAEPAVATPVVSCYATRPTNAAGAAPTPAVDYALANQNNVCTLSVRMQAS